MERSLLGREQQLSNLEKKIDALRIGQDKKQVEKNQEKKDEVKGEINGKKQVGDDAEGKKTPIYFYDQASGKWFIHPDLQQYFITQLEIIQQLKKTVNQKWTEHQFKEYFRFLTDYETYISTFIFGFQIPTFQDFLAWRQAVKPYNPIGCELYEKQLFFIRQKYDSEPENKSYKVSMPPKAQRKKEENKIGSYKLKQRYQKASGIQSLAPKVKKRYVQKWSEA